MDTNKREDKPIHHQTIKTNPIQSLKRAQQRTMMMRIFIIQVRDPVIHLEVDEEQQAITQGSKRQAERTGFLAPYLSGLRHTDAPHAWT